MCIATADVGCGESIGVVVDIEVVLYSTLVTPCISWWSNESRFASICIWISYAQLGNEAGFIAQSGIEARLRYGPNGYTWGL